MKIVKNKLYNDIKTILEQARNNAVRAVNFSMVIAYWEIGKRIVEDEQGGNKKAKYGEHVLKDLSEKLTVDFGKGFTPTNLKYFRQFYLVFSKSSIGHAVSDQLVQKDKSPILLFSNCSIKNSYRTYSKCFQRRRIG